MNEKVRILLVEDFPPDAELAEIEIRQSITDSVFLTVKTKVSFLDALDNFKPDIIVSDFMMPQFDGLTALKLTLEKTPDTPFILFTGSMNEDTAVECMKLGATDYIIKEHIKRLGASVKNALEKSKVVSQKKIAEKISHQAIQDQELLLTTANKLLVCKDIQEVYQIVFEAVKILDPSSYLIISENNPEENIQKILYHRGFDSYLKWLDKLFKINQSEFAVPLNRLSPAELIDYNSGKLILEPGGIYKVSAKIIPKDAAALIEKALKIKESYYIGFSSQDQQFGILALLKKEKGYPPKADIIEIIMGQASQAIQKFYALKLTQLNEARLQSLLNINQFQTESIQTLLDKALDEIVKLTQSKIGYIYYYQTDKKQFILNSWSKEVMSQCKVNQPETIYDLDKTGIWGEVVRQSTPIMVNHFESPNPLKKGYPEGHVAIKKFLSIPVFYKGSIVAVAGVANKETDYTQSDINQLTIMMDSVWKTTKQKETDLLLVENEEKYKAIMNQSLDNIYLAEMDTMRIIEANPAICQFLGYHLDEIKSFSIDKIVDSPPEKLRELIQYLKNKEKLYLGERNYRKKNGEIAIVEANATIIKYHNKEVICVISHDITQRKIAEQALFESREKLRMILNYTPISTATFDENGFLLQSNQSFKDLFCLSNSMESYDFNILQNTFVTEKEIELLNNGEVLKLEKNYSFDQLETIFQSKINRTGTIDLELTIKAVEVNPTNHQLEYFLQLQDITDRKKLENIKNDFINTVSHEMRTPLTSIRESIIILKNHYQSNLSTDQIELLDISLRNINRLGKLIQDVLDFQKLNAVLMEFNQKPEQINDVITQILLDLSSYTNTYNIKIKTDLCPDLPFIKFDKERISQVLINLINNAVKNTKQGSITIKTEMVQDSRKVKISVSDTGCGIKPENLDKIFIPFFQIKEDVDYKSGGTGLGLSISNRILEGHDSKLYVISEFGIGSTFYFFLPID